MRIGPSWLYRAFGARIHGHCVGHCARYVPNGCYAAAIGIGSRSLSLLIALWQVALAYRSKLKKIPCTRATPLSWYIRVAFASCTLFSVFLLRVLCSHLSFFYALVSFLFFFVQLFVSRTRTDSVQVSRSGFSLLLR